jgi:hypothetical protein
MACCLTHVPLSPSQNSQPALNTRITTKSIRLHVIFGNHLQCTLFLTHFFIMNIIAIAVIDIVVVVVGVAAFMLRRLTE